MENNTSIYSDIGKQIRTTKEQVEFLNGIDEVLKQLYTNKPISPEKMTELFGQKTAEKIQKSFSDIQLDLTNPGRVREYFTALSEHIREAEVIHATLAIAPDAQILDILGEWLEITFPNQAVVIELSHNSAIVGGLQLDYKGHYWDYSLENQVTKIFREKKEELFTTTKSPK